MVREENNPQIVLFLLPSPTSLDCIKYSKRTLKKETTIHGRYHNIIYVSFQLNFCERCKFYLGYFLFSLPFFSTYGHPVPFIKKLLFHCGTGFVCLPVVAYLSSFFSFVLKAVLYEINKTILAYI